MANFNILLKCQPTKYFLALKIQKLYLIVSGTVAVYTDDGDEVAHLHDGNIFGETAFLLFDETQVRWCIGA